MIEINHVSKSYGSHMAVRDVAATIRPGEVTGLLGPNGAGKSTLLRIITGFLAPAQGSVAVCGHDTLRASHAARSHLGYLPETLPVYPEMSVRGFLLFRASIFGIPGGQRRAAVNSAVERCWLTDVSSKRIGHLSKGFRQRVGLAAAILHNPRVLVLDEPTSGLDPSQITQVRELIRSLAAQRTVLFSSHILPEVEQTCDRVLIMARGCLLADGTPSDLIARHAADAPLIARFAGGRGGDAHAAAACAQALPGCGVQPDRPRPGTFTVHIPPAFAGDPCEALSRHAAARGLLLTELRRERPSLEQVFLRVISQPDGSAADPQTHAVPSVAA